MAASQACRTKGVAEGPASASHCAAGMSVMEPNTRTRSEGTSTDRALLPGQLVLAVQPPGGTGADLGVLGFDRLEHRQQDALGVEREHEVALGDDAGAGVTLQRHRALAVAHR